jgi:hypothetical protein
MTRSQAQTLTLRSLHPLAVAFDLCLSVPGYAIPRVADCMIGCVENGSRKQALSD